MLRLNLLRDIGENDDRQFWQRYLRREGCDGDRNKMLTAPRGDIQLHFGKGDGVSSSKGAIDRVAYDVVREATGAMEEILVSGNCAHPEEPPGDIIGGEHAIAPIKHDQAKGQGTQQSLIEGLRMSSVKGRERDWLRARL